MSRVGRVRISGIAPNGKTAMRGQDLRIELVDENGNATAIPAKSAQIVIVADGRRNEVSVRLIASVAELKFDCEAEIDER